MFKHGTSSVVPVANMLHTFPYKNRTSGQSPNAATLDGARIVESFATRGGGMHNCMTGCIVQCSNIVHDANGNYKTSALEFETLALLGSNCAVATWQDVAELDRACDEIGLDTIETGAAIAVLMDSGQDAVGRLRGDGEADPRGDPEGHASAARRSASGVVATGKFTGHTRVPHGARPGHPGLGSAAAQGHRRHLLHQPDGRRPHRRPRRSTRACRPRSTRTSRRSRSS